MSSVRPVAS